MLIFISNIALVWEVAQTLYLQVLNEIFRFVTKANLNRFLQKFQSSTVKQRCSSFTSYPSILHCISTLELAEPFSIEAKQQHIIKFILIRHV